MIVRAGAAGVAAGKDAAPVLVRTEVRAALVGVSVGRGGDVTVEECRVDGRAVAGASVRAGDRGKFSRSRLRGGRFGLYFDEPGGHSVDDCVLLEGDDEVAA